METNQLSTAEYWNSEGIDVRLNPKLSYDSSGLETFLSEEEGIRSAVVVATSGSSGEVKFVVLKKSALLASAAMVNEWCDVTDADVWWGGLSTFHVGGLGIFARAVLSGSRVVVPESREWNRGAGYAESLEKSGVTLTSLTPVHLHDLVVSGTRSPAGLRGLFLGGGRITDQLAERAVELGWPIWPTYGMSEAGSQIATSVEGNHELLPVLPNWDVRVGEKGGALEIRGEALFSGYASKVDGCWSFQESTQADGFFVTGDVVVLEEKQLRFRHRADDLVKVLGELVSLSKVEAVARNGGAEVIVIPLPDARLETRLVAAFEGGPDAAANWLIQTNQKLSGIEQIAEVRPVVEFPRTEIGKVDRKELASLF
ncbi:MAG: AMP-binding protein [Verrucomicrobiales bacterium]|nr:AMP-binding protein [Verrucomicrobiales bacterium]